MEREKHERKRHEIFWKLCTLVVATSPHINVSSVLEILLVARHSYSLHTGLHPYSHVRPTSSQPFESVAGMHVETSETTPRTCFPLAFRRFFISSTVNLSVPPFFLKIFSSWTCPVNIRPHFIHFSSNFSSSDYGIDYGNQAIDYGILFDRIIFFHIVINIINIVYNIHTTYM